MHHSRLFSLFLIFLALILGSFAAAAFSPQVAQSTPKPGTTVRFQGTAAHPPQRLPASPHAAPHNPQPKELPPV